MLDDLDRQLATVTRDVYLTARGWLAATPSPATPAAVDVLDRAWLRRSTPDVAGIPDERRRVLVTLADRADVVALVEQLRDPYVAPMLTGESVRRVLKALAVALEVEVWALDGELEALVDGFGDDHDGVTM